MAKGIAAPPPDDQDLEDRLVESIEQYDEDATLDTRLDPARPSAVKLLRKGIMKIRYC